MTVVNVVVVSCVVVVVVCVVVVAPIIVEVHILCCCGGSWRLPLSFCRGGWVSGSFSCRTPLQLKLSWGCDKIH